jgi:hypothetical protein
MVDTYDVMKCPDEHYRRVIYGIGPFIADYPEQVWLSGIVQGWCPKSVILYSICCASHIIITDVMHSQII